MSIPLAPKPGKDNLTARERALRAELAAPVAAERNALMSRLRPWLMAALGVALGVTLGVVVMRHRHQAQENLVAVNGVAITKGELFDRLQLAGGPAMMQRLIAERLDLQFAAKRGVLPTDEQVEEKFQQQHSNPNFARQLALSGLSENDYKYNLRVKMAQAAVLTQGITVSEAEVKAYYTQQSDPATPNALFYQPETILVRAIGNPNPQQIALAQKELATNTPFEIVAAQHSVDPGSKDRGGLLQPLVQGRSPLSQTPELEKSLFSLKIGPIYGPVKFHNGYWLFRIEEKKSAQVRPFAEVKDDCEVNTKMIKGTRLHGKEIGASFKDFRGKSVIQSFVPQFNQVAAAH